MERVALTRDLPEEGLVADDAGTVVLARENTAERPPAFTWELSSVAEEMLEEATVETGAARMSRDVEIRAPVA